MQIITVKKVEDCFDGSSIYGYEFDEDWTRDKIMRLKTLGEVEYFSEFMRPLFRLHCEGGLIVKGVEGRSTCRAVYPRKGKKEMKKSFEETFGITG